MVCVQCMYIVALPRDIDPVNQCHILYNTCSDLRLAKSIKMSGKTQSVVDMNSDCPTWCSVQVLTSSVNLLSRFV